MENIHPWALNKKGFSPKPDTTEFALFNNHKTFLNEWAAEPNKFINYLLGLSFCTKLFCISASCIFISEN